MNLSLLLYADDFCLMVQHKDVEEIKKVFNNSFQNISIAFFTTWPSKNAMQCPCTTTFWLCIPTWYPNLNGKLKKTANNANKCIRFCLKLDKMHQNISDRNITWQNMYVDYFKTMNWLSVDQWVQQRLNITIFIYVNNVCLITWKKSLNMLHKVE